jgi:hypothetical protein
MVNLLWNCECFGGWLSWIWVLKAQLFKTVDVTWQALVKDGSGSVIENSVDTFVVDGFLPFLLILKCVRHSRLHKLGYLVFFRV